MIEKFDYTKEHDEWLLENFYKFDTTKKLIDEFNRNFNTNCNYDNVKIRCYRKLKLTRTKKQRNYYTEEEVIWFKKNCNKYLVKGYFEEDLFIKDFYNKFNKKMSYGTLLHFIYIRCDMKLGHFKKLAKPKKQLPIGTERKNDGKWYIKIKNGFIDKGTNKYSNPYGNWQLKSRYLYEKYHNCKLDNNDIIIFLDGNEENFEKDNLIKLTKQEFNILNGCRFASLKDIKLKKSAILYSQIQAKLKVSD